MALAPIQYTIRSIPPEVDTWLKGEAQRQGVSFNQFIVNELTTISGATHAYRSLADLTGSWQEDDEFDRILEDQRQIDPGLWK